MENDTQKRRQMMETKDMAIAISGVPKGQDFYGDEPVANYAKGLYRPEYTLAKHNLFIINVREEQGKYYFYYSYLIPNTSDSDKRSGGYFALTLKVKEHYCEDLSRLYQLFKQVCDNMVTGVFLNKDKKFLINAFASRKDKYEELIKRFKELLASYFSNSFTKLENNSGKIKTDGSTLQRHVSENGCDLYSDELFACRNVSLAPEIPRTISLIAPLEKQLADTKLQLKNTSDALKRTTDELNRCKGENENLKRWIDELKRENENLNRRIDELKRENDKLKDRKKTFSEINERWKEMENSFSEMRESMRLIMPSCESMGQQRREKENPVDQGVAKFKKWISGHKKWWIIGVLLVFGVLLFWIFYPCDKAGGGNSGNTDSSTETATEESAQHTSRAIDFELGDTLVVSDTVLHAGDTVVFTLKKDGRDCYDGGKWAADGFSSPDNSTGGTQRVIVKCKDTATISFTPEKDTVKYRMRFPIRKE